MSSAATPDPESLAEANLDLIESMMRVTYQAWHSLEKDDVMGAAYEGLMSAVSTYDHAEGASFRTWASNKIKWAIIDFCRQEIDHRQHEAPLETEIRESRGKIAQRDKPIIQPQPIVKPVLRMTMKSDKPDLSAMCDCGHENFHHARMACMYWDRRLPGSGWCQCDGFQVKRR